MKYRLEIDGLRALAVLPVIFFHAGFELFRGGYVGVDVFFVISGYLITSIIINQLEKKQFSIINFYERRARRIFPALFFVMLLNIPIAFFTMLPDPLENFGQSLVATSLFANNILLYLTSGYWDLASEYKPLLHTWSLAVEEQYYIIFPILMTMLWGFGVKKIIYFFVTLFFISLGFAQWESSNNPEAGFYLLHTRAFEILIGVFIAFYFKKYGYLKSSYYNQFLSLLGFVLIVFSIFAFDETTPFPSIYTLIPALGTGFLILCTTKETVIYKLMSNKILVFIGLISYSSYLFHQSIFSFIRIISKNEPTSSLMLWGIIITFIAAYFSYKLIESPFRDFEKMSRKKLILILSSAFVFIVSSGLILALNNGFNQRIYDGNFNKLEKSKIINSRAYDYIKNNYNDLDVINIMVVGNSFGRDVVNIILETYPRNQLEIAYTSELNVCQVNDKISDFDILKNSDIIIFASDYSDKKCIDELLSKKNNNEIFFVGTKQFGYNLNWIMRIQKDERSMLRNNIIDEAIKEEIFLKSIVPEENFISYMDILSTENKILITNKDGNLISDDRAHLTLSGSRYVGENVFKKHRISEFILK